MKIVDNLKKIVRSISFLEPDFLGELNYTKLTIFSLHLELNF